MSIRFTIATLTDIDNLIALMAEYYLYDQHEFHEREARNTLELFLSVPHYGRAWLIQTEGEIVGYLVVTLGFSLEFLGKDAFIDEIYIREHYRGKGIGRQAMALAENYCRAEGVKAIHLEVEQHNSVTMLYQQLGYKAENSTFMTKLIG